MMLAKAIYSAAGINSQILVHQEYRNLNGFLLAEGDPTNPLFCKIGEFLHAYAGARAIGWQYTIEPWFVPDHVAYHLVRGVYFSFGIGVQYIPFFDRHRNFNLGYSYQMRSSLNPIPHNPFLN